MEIPELIDQRINAFRERNNTNPRKDYYSTRAYYVKDEDTVYVAFDRDTIAMGNNTDGYSVVYIFRADSESRVHYAKVYQYRPEARWDNKDVIGFECEGDTVYGKTRAGSRISL